MMVCKPGRHGLFILSLVLVALFGGTNASIIACDTPLGMESGKITDDMIITSSDTPGTNKTYARFNCCHGDTDKAWCPDPKLNGTALVTVNFKKLIGVSGLAVQVPSSDVENATRFLETFNIAYNSVTNTREYAVGIFDRKQGVSGIDPTTHEARISIGGIVTNSLTIELAFPKGKPCFRFELFGCEPKALCPEGCGKGQCAEKNKCECGLNFKGNNCEEPVIPDSVCKKALGMQDKSIQDSQLAVSSYKPDKEKGKARWKCCEGEDSGAWCPQDNDTSPYYEVTFPKPVLIGAIAMDFPSHKAAGAEMYLKSYRLAWLPENAAKLVYTKENFTAADNATLITGHTFQPILTTRLIIIPVSWENSPCFRFELYACDPKELCPFGCQNNGTCIDRNHCKCPDGYSGIDCSYSKYQILVDHQADFTFESIKGTTLVTKQYNLNIHGDAQLVQGQIGKALYLNGQSQYMEIKQQDIGCLANIGRCKSGFTMSMTINFIAFTEGMYVFSSGGESSKSSGVTCQVQGSKFVVVVSTAIDVWKGFFSLNLVKLHTWTKFEYSWSFAQGVRVFVNNVAVLSVTKPTSTRPTPVYQSHKLVFGSTPIGSKNVFAKYLIENYKTWFVAKTDLVHVGIIQTSKCPGECLNKGKCLSAGKCQCTEGFDGLLCEISKVDVKQFNMTFISQEQTGSVSVSGKWTVKGGPKFIHEEVGMVVKIVDYKHTLTFEANSANPCYKNLDLCFKGITYNLDLKVLRWEENMYILSNGPNKKDVYGVSFYYALNQLQVSVRTTTQMWVVKFPSSPTCGIWHHVEYSWSQTEGLVVYLNKTVIGYSLHGTVSSVAATHMEALTIGTPSGVEQHTNNPSFEVANVQFWLASRTVLQTFKILPEAITMVPTSPGPITTVPLHTTTRDNGTPTGSQPSPGPITTVPLHTTTRHNGTPTGSQPSPAVVNTTVTPLKTTFSASHSSTQTPSTTARAPVTEKSTVSPTVTSAATSLPLSSKLSSNTTNASSKSTVRANPNATVSVPTATSSKSTLPVSSTSVHVSGANTTLTASTTSISGSTVTAGSKVTTISSGTTSSRPSASKSTVSTSSVSGATHSPSKTTVHDNSSTALKTTPQQLLSTSSTPLLPATSEQNYTWAFEKYDSKLTTISHKDVTLTLIGGAKFTIENKLHVISFTKGTKQFIDFTSTHRSCLTDVNLCSSGYTVSFEVKFTSLEENTYIISSGGENPLATGLAVVYRFGKLQFMMSHLQKAWYCHVQRPTLNAWLTFDLTWHVNTGLEVYLNNKLQEHSKIGVQFTQTHTVHVEKHFYFASSTTTIQKEQDFHGFLQSLSTWFVSRTVLVQQGILKPAITTVPPSTPKEVTMSPPLCVTPSAVTEKPSTATNAPSTSTAAPTSTAKAKVTETSAQTTATNAPTTSTKAPTTSTKAPPTTTNAPATTTKAPITLPSQFTCPVGCIKKEEIATDKPPKPDKPTLIIDVSKDIQSTTYFVCKFQASEQTNLRHIVKWTIGDKDFTDSKMTRSAGVSEARINPAELSGTLLNKKVCCSVQSMYVGMCGGKYSDVVQSECITPEIKLLTSKLNVKEGSTAGKIQLTISVPPSTLCSLETGTKCEVRILATLVESSHDKKCSSRPLPEVLFLPHLAGSRYHACGSSFINVNWNETMEIQLKAGIDGVYDRNQIRIIKLSVKIVGINTLPSIAMGQVQVTVIDGDRRALCTSTGDPHVQTYDGQRYDNYLEGELIMYRHNTRPYEVRAKQKRCSSKHSRPTCNCGVAVRAGDDVITLSRCDIVDDHHHHHHTTAMPIQLYLNGKLTSGTTIRRLGCGQKYEVYLPTGTKISVQAVTASFINFWITPSAADYNSVTGLCGNFNGQRADEYTGPDGTSFSKYLRYHQPDPYIASWRATESIFTGVAMMREEEEQRYCNCFDPEHAPCGISYDITRCVSSSAYDVTALLVKQARAPRLVTTKHRRAVINPPVSFKQTNCNSTQWTLDEATDYCDEYLTNSTAAMNCGKHLNFTNDKRVADCAKDLVCTDDVVYARSMIDDIISTCVEEAGKQVATPGDNSSSDALAALVKNLCVEECKNNGSCLQGLCACADGFSGVDCSIGKNSIPVVDDLPADGEPCDMERDNCDVAPVTGDDFIDSEDLKCELTYIKVADTVTTTTKTEIVNGTYLDISRVNCPMYKTESVKVKVTNNGQTFSVHSYLHVVFDSKCSVCSLDRNTDSAVCKERDDVCRIDGHCYINGDAMANDHCRVCNVASSKTAWSTAQGSKCQQTTQAPVTAAHTDSGEGINKTDKIIIGVVCGVVGLCIIIVAIFLLKRRSSRRGTNGELSFPAEEPHTVQLHREKTDMIKPMMNTNQAFRDESLRS